MKIHESLPQKIYPVVDRAFWINRLGAAGARFIQIRIKDMSGDELRGELIAALHYARQHDVQLVVNDFWQEAIALGAPWLHLGQEDLAEADRDAIRKAGLKVGISTHDAAELDTALRWEPDYVALGPIWPTTLKNMPCGPQGSAKLTEWKQRIGTLPLVAIGGITRERAPECLRAGADCVSAVSDFIRQPDPENQVTSWLRATETA